jgi:hypothetical protein
MNIKDFAEKVIKAEEEAFQKGNFEPLKALEDPNVVYHMPLGLPDMVGHEAHKQQIIDARQLWSDIKQEWQYLTGEGNLLVFSFKSSFRITGTKPGYTFPVGKKGSSDEIIVCRVKKGRLVEGWAKGSFTFTD